MNLTTFRSRRQQRRPARREITAGYPEAPRLPVPAVQQQHQRESGPHPVLPASVPPGARPEEDASRYWPLGEHPYPTGPQPSFTPAPGCERPQARAEERRPRGSRHTQAYTPDFAETGRPARPYAAPESLPAHLLPALSQDTPMLPPAIGDHLAATWPAPAPVEGHGLDAWHEMCALRYPAHNLNATFIDYGTLLRRTSEVTGTQGTRLWPLAALPPADPRWKGLADSLEETAKALDETDQWHAQAYRRLRQVVTAAPDYATALRAVQLAADAGITRHVSFAPAAPEKSWDADREGDLREVLAAAVWKAHRHYAENPANLGTAGKAGRYADLHDAIVNAGDDGLAVLFVHAAIRSGRASLGDIAERGSALEALFTGLDAKGAAA